MRPRSQRKAAGAASKKLRIEDSDGEEEEDGGAASSGGDDDPIEDASGGPSCGASVAGQRRGRKEAACRAWNGALMCCAVQRLLPAGFSAVTYALHVAGSEAASGSEEEEEASEEEASDYVPSE